MANKWQAAYEIIRYTKYVTAYYNQSTDMLWLKNKHTRTLMCINDSSMDSIDIEKISKELFYNQEMLNNSVGFKVKCIYIYYLNSNKEKRVFKSNSLKVIHYGIKNISEIILNPFYKIDTKYKKLKQNEWYKRRVLSGNPLEMYMIKSTPMTTVLIMINTLLFLINLYYIHIKDSLYFTNELGLIHFNVVDGEYYRLISSAFLHADMEHFLFNIFAIYILGKFVESIYSYIHLFVAYILTAIFANIVSLTFITDTLSLGASGAAYGLLGILIIYMLMNKKINRKLIIQIALVFIIISVLSSFFSNINHYAHIGGLIYGLFLGVLYQYKKTDWKIIVPIFILTLATPIILSSVFIQHDSYQPIDEVGLQYLYEGKYKDALDTVNQTFKDKKETSTTHYILAKLYDASGDIEQAHRHFEKSFELNPTNELALKYKLYKLRKTRNFEQMGILLDKINRNQIYDEELKVIEEEVKSRGY